MGYGFLYHGVSLLVSVSCSGLVLFVRYLRFAAA